jgi:hypothetical protein
MHEQEKLVEYPDAAALLVTVRKTDLPEIRVDFIGAFSDLSL